MYFLFTLSWLIFIPNTIVLCVHSGGPILDYQPSWQLFYYQYISFLPQLLVPLYHFTKYTLYTMEHVEKKNTMAFEMSYNLAHLLAVFNLDLLETWCEKQWMAYYPKSNPIMAPWHAMIVVSYALVLQQMPTNFYHVHYVRFSLNCFFIQS